MFHFCKVRNSGLTLENRVFRNPQISLFDLLAEHQKSPIFAENQTFGEKYQMSPYVTTMHFRHVRTCHEGAPTALVGFWPRNPTNPKCSILAFLALYRGMYRVGVVSESPGLTAASRPFEVVRPHNANSTRENSPPSCHWVRRNVPFRPNHPF